MDEWFVCILHAGHSFIFAKVILVIEPPLSLFFSSLCVLAFICLGLWWNWALLHKTFHQQRQITTGSNEESVALSTHYRGQGNSLWFGLSYGMLSSSVWSEVSTESTRRYSSHHLASIVFTEICLIAFSHAIIVQRVGDRLFDGDGGLFNQPLGLAPLGGGGLNEEVRRCSWSPFILSYFICMFWIFVFCNSIVLRGNGWQFCTLPRNFYLHSAFFNTPFFPSKSACW